MFGDERGAFATVPPATPATPDREAGDPCEKCLSFPGIPGRSVDCTVSATVQAEPMQVFGPIRSLEVRSLAGPVLDVNVPAGVSLMHEGEAIGTFFVIRSGTADVWHADRRLGTLGTGDCFGEIDPASNEPQRISVIASSPMRLLTFSAFGIDRLCATIPEARERIIASLPEESEAEEVPPAPWFAARS